MAERIIFKKDGEFYKEGELADFQNWDKDPTQGIIRLESGEIIKCSFEDFKFLNLPTGANMFENGLPS